MSNTVKNPNVADARRYWIEGKTLSDIGDAIREFRGTESGIELQDIPEEIGKVHDVGYEKGKTEGYDAGHTEGYTEGQAEGYETGYSTGKTDGYAEGYEVGKSEGGNTEEAYNEGVEAGKEEAYSEVESINDELEQTLYGTDTGGKSFYDEFWDRFQSNRESLNSTMTGIFHGRFWGFDNFYPKYDIKPVGSAGQYLFYAWENLYGDSEGSLKQRLKECGVVLDTSQATSLHAAFAYGRFTELPTIDCSLVNVGTMVFAHSSKLHTIDKVIVSETVEFTNWFNNCPALKNITFEGVIGQNIDFKPSTKLSADSIRSIIEHLSTSASGKSVTLSKTAVNNAFTDAEWKELTDTRLNWTISLV